MFRTREFFWKDIQESACTSGVNCSCWSSGHSDNLGVTWGSRALDKLFISQLIRFCAFFLNKFQECAHTLRVNCF